MTDWLRKSFRGILTIAAMGVFLSLVHSLVHFDVSEQIIGILGAALILSGQWVSRFVNSYTNGSQSQSD